METEITHRKSGAQCLGETKDGHTRVHVHAHTRGHTLAPAAMAATTPTQSPDWDKDDQEVAQITRGQPLPDKPFSSERKNSETEKAKSRKRPPWNQGLCPEAATEARLV